MMFPKNRFLLWATAVLLIAAFLRLLALDDVPPGLSQDEVLNADIVTFIQGGQHALFFREGYGHEPLYHYWSVPFQPLFGDNILSIRLPAVYLGLLFVAVTMRWAKREFGLVTAVTVGVGLAVSWWPIIFSRIGLRPILEPLLLVLFAWFWPRRPWLAGFFLGLTVYSYTAARVVLIIPLLLALYLWWQKPAQTSLSWRTSLIVFGVALALYLPLDLTLRADPALQQRVTQLSGPLDALREGDVQPIWETTRATLGVFSWTGDPRWTYSLPERPFFDPLTAFFFYGGLLVAFVRWRQPLYGFILIWLGITLLPSAVTPQAPSTIRLIGAMPIVYLLPGLAFAWLGARWANGRRLLYMGGVFLVSFNLFLTVRDGFVRWPAALETRLKYQTVLQEMGRYWLIHDQPMVPVLADAFFEPIDADSFRRDVGFDLDVRWVQTGIEVAGAIVFPHEQQGQDGRLYIPEFAAPSVDLLTAANIAQRPLYRSEDVPSFAVYAMPPMPEIPAVTTPVTLDEMVTLIGYQVLPLAPERPLRVFSYWRVEALLPADLSGFAHLLTDETTIVAQHDGLDVAVVTLEPGDIFIQRHPMPVPEAGTYILQVGLYTRGDGRRLVRSGNVPMGEPTDRIILDSALIFDGK